jgi:hypothetical protein
MDKELDKLIEQENKQLEMSFLNDDDDMKSS